MFLRSLTNKCTIGSTSLLYFLKQRRYRRKTIVVKFKLLTSGDLNFDLSLKIAEAVSKWVLTRALLGGGRLNAPPPSGFSRIAKKRRRAAPPGFHPPYPPSFSQLLWKFRPKAMWGQVTRSGQVTQLQNNFPIAPRLQCFRESYETFGIWWGHQCLQNVYLGFLISVTSGQVIFATSPL